MKAIFSTRLSMASTDGEYEWIESTEDMRIDGDPLEALRGYVGDIIEDSTKEERLAISDDHNGCIHNLPAEAIVVTLNEVPTWIFWVETLDE